MLYPICMTYMLTAYRQQRKRRPHLFLKNEIKAWFCLIMSSRFCYWTSDLLQTMAWLCWRSSSLNESSRWINILSCFDWHFAVASSSLQYYMLVPATWNSLAVAFSRACFAFRVTEHVLWQMMKKRQELFIYLDQLHEVLMLTQFSRQKNYGLLLPCLFISLTIAPV